MRQCIKNNTEVFGKNWTQTIYFISQFLTFLSTSKFNINYSAASWLTNPAKCKLLSQKLITSKHETKYSLLYHRRPSVIFLPLLLSAWRMVSNLQSTLSTKMEMLYLKSYCISLNHIWIKLPLSLVVFSNIAVVQPNSV